MTSLRRQWKAYLRTVETEVYSHKEAHKSAVIAYEKALLAFADAVAAAAEDADAVAPVMPVEPAYTPVGILEFWGAHQVSFPIIAQIAHWLLVIVISSAEVERLFSRGGLITSRRNRRGAAKEELLLLTAYNLTREWKVGGQAASAEEGIVMRRLLSACDGGLDTDPDEPE